MRVIPENNSELITADSTDNIVPAAAPPHQNSSLFQQFIAGQMTLNIIVMFEVIDIEDKQRDPPALSSRAFYDLP